MRTWARYVAAVEDPGGVEERLAAGTVTPEDAEKLLKGKKDVAVLDVRTPEEFARGHIPGAKNVDFFGDDFAKNVGALDPAAPVLVHCGSGKRSTQALPSLKNQKTVYHLNEGFSAWEKAGKPVEGAGKK